MIENPPQAKVEKRFKTKLQSFFVFESGGRLYANISDHTSDLLNQLRAMCIELSPEGIPEQRDQYDSVKMKTDYLENIESIRELVKSSYLSLIDDECMPYMAIEVIYRHLTHYGVQFITKRALRRIVDLPVDSRIAKKSGMETVEIPYSFENLSNSLSNLSRVVVELEKKIDSGSFLAGFAKHSAIRIKEGSFAVYSDEIKQKKGQEMIEILHKARNYIDDEINKEVIQSFYRNAKQHPEGLGDLSMVELNPISMIHLIKRLLLLYREKPQKTRRIIFSKSRKRIIKIE